MSATCCVLKAFPGMGTLRFFGLLLTLAMWDVVGKIVTEQAAAQAAASIDPPAGQGGAGTPERGCQCLNCNTAVQTTPPGEGDGTSSKMTGNTAETSKTGYADEADDALTEEDKALLKEADRLLDEESQEATRKLATLNEKVLKSAEAAADECTQDSPACTEVAARRKQLATKLARLNKKERLVFPRALERYAMEALVKTFEEDVAKYDAARDAEPREGVSNSGKTVRKWSKREKIIRDHYTNAINTFIPDVTGLDVDREPAQAIKDMIKVTTDHRERVDRAWAKFREKKSNWEKELEKQENGEAAAAAPGGGASFVDVHKHNSGFVVV